MSQPKRLGLRPPSSVPANPTIRRVNITSKDTEVVAVAGPSSGIVRPAASRSGIPARGQEALQTMRRPPSGASGLRPPGGALGLRPPSGAMGLKPPTKSSGMRPPGGPVGLKPPRESGARPPSGATRPQREPVGKPAVAHVQVKAIKTKNAPPARAREPSFPPLIEPDRSIQVRSGLINISSKFGVVSSPEGLKKKIERYLPQTLSSHKIESNYRGIRDEESYQRKYKDVVSGLFTLDYRRAALEGVVEEENDPFDQQINMDAPEDEWNEVTRELWRFQQEEERSPPRAASPRAPSPRVASPRTPRAPSPVPYGPSPNIPSPYARSPQISSPHTPPQLSPYGPPNIPSPYARSPQISSPHTPPQLSPYGPPNIPSPYARSPQISPHTPSRPFPYARSPQPSPFEPPSVPSPTARSPHTLQVQVPRAPSVHKRRHVSQIPEASRAPSMRGSSRSPYGPSVDVPSPYGRSPRAPRAPKSPELEVSELYRRPTVVPEIIITSPDEVTKTPDRNVNFETPTTTTVCTRESIMFPDSAEDSPFLICPPETSESVVYELSRPIQQIEQIQKTELTPPQIVRTPLGYAAVTHSIIESRSCEVTDKGTLVDVTIEGSRMVSPDTVEKMTVKKRDVLLPADVHTEEIKALVIDENRDIEDGLLLMKTTGMEQTDLQSKLKRIKVGSVRLLEESLEHVLPELNETGEQLCSDTIASMMHDEERGIEKPLETPKPDSKEDKKLETPDAHSSLEEIYRKEPMEETPSDESTAEKKDTPETSSPRSDEPKVGLEAELPPWDIELGSLNELIVGSTDETLTPENIHRLRYIEDCREPKRHSRGQLRGTTMPLWFPGYYFMFPNTGEFISTKRSPSGILDRAWRTLKPYEVLENTEVTIV